MAPQNRARNPRNKRKVSLTEQFKNNYTDLTKPYAHGGISIVSKSTDLSSKNVQEKLPHVYSYGLHREYHKPKHFNPFYMYFPRQQLQVDLIDISSYKTANDGVTFLMTAIDCFTKKAWVKPLKSKTMISSLQALKLIFNEMESLPKSIFFDRGNTHTHTF